MAKVEYTPETIKRCQKLTGFDHIPGLLQTMNCSNTTEIINMCRSKAKAKKAKPHKAAWKKVPIDKSKPLKKKGD